MHHLGAILSRIIWTAVLWVSLLGPAAHAQDTPAADDPKAVQRDVLVLVRALAYDRNLEARFGEELKIGVLHSQEDPEEEARTAVAVIKALSEVKVGGLSVGVMAVPWTDTEALKDALDQQKLDVLYVPRGMDEAAAALPAICQEMDRTTITRHRPYVDGGLAIGVELFEDKPRLVVNLPSAKAEGAAISSQLLRLADVLR